MQLCLTLEHRFFQTPDKRVWTITQCGYDFYREYLQVFDSVRVISRVFPVARVESNFLPVEGPGVEFYAIPGYKGPFGLLAQFIKVRERAKHAVPMGSAVILRVHSQVANSVEEWLTRRGLPYSLEVTADPYDVLSPMANQHPVAPIARRYFTRRMQRQCRQAIAVSYVTQTYLQQRYPADFGGIADDNRSDGNGRYDGRCVVAVSDVNLPPECFISQPRRGLHDPSLLRIVFVGTLGSFYKGPDILIDAAAICKEQRVPVRVKFVGCGEKMEDLRKRCIRLGIEDQVEFVGSITAGEAVRRELDEADIFILPSRAEGVPRAMLEAMARGLPCLGSAVGGIPELLHSEDLVPPDNPAALAKAITSIIQQPSRLGIMSARNLVTASAYSTAVLQCQRLDFYRAVRKLTAEAYADRQSERLQELHPVRHDSQALDRDVSVS